MKTFEGIGDASTQVRNYLIQHQAKLPEHLKDQLTRLTDTGTSPVDLTVNFVDAVYANQQDFDAEAKDIAAGAAVVCATFGFHDMALEHRGSRIAKILGGEKLAKDSHPAPNTTFLPKPEEDDEPSKAA